MLDAIEGGVIAGVIGVAENEADGDAARITVAEAVQRRVDLVLDGARKRNERVRLPPASR